MKKLILIIVFVLFTKPIYATNNASIDFKSIPLAEEYNKYEDFNVDKLPEEMFYKLNYDCKYILNKSKQLYIKSSEWGGVIVYYDNHMVDLGIDEEIGIDEAHTSIGSNLYLIRSNNEYYIFVDKLFCNDWKGYDLYHLLNEKIELVEGKSGRIDFVGYNYIIGYTDLGMIGYQRCEFKKVFRNGKLELDGEYKVAQLTKEETSYPFWLYYTLVKDLEYEEYDNRTKKYKKKVLKVGTKIRSLSTDAKTYINIEVEDGRKGKVKVDNVEERDFFVNGQLFMDYYFLDGSKYRFEVVRSVSVY